MTTLTFPNTAADAALRELRRLNTAITTRQLGGGIAILAPASSFSLPVTSSFSTLNPATEKLGPFHRAPAYLSGGSGPIGVDR
jgi:hypothetical protein